MTSKPTMRDVARIAGVSTMTVSRVLAHPDLVAEVTRARVAQVIEELGYVPDLIASSLSSKKSGFIAAILPTLNNVNFAETAGGLTEALRVSEFQLLIGYTDYRIREEEALVRAMLARRPEGIVICGSNHNAATRQLLEAADIPVVQIWDLPVDPIGHVVGFSNFEAGRAMTMRLIERGYRRIAFLGPPEDEPGFRDYRGDERLAGYLSAIEQSGLPKDMVIRHGRGAVSFTHGAESLAALLAKHGHVDAVIAVSDPSAVGALMECQRRGIRVPDDLAIAGFGNFEIGTQTNPSLTTVRVDCTGIGRRTGQLLRDLLATSNADHLVEQEMTDLGFDVVERQSTNRIPTSPSIK